jgi:hypothetical protein
MVCVDAGWLFGPRLDAPLRAVGFMTTTTILLPFSVYMTRRLLRAYVIGDGSGLRIYNGIRTHVIPWSEVEGFVGSSRPFLMAVKRTHGRALTMTGITPGPLGDPEPQRQNMLELEALWQRCRSKAPM